MKRMVFKFEDLYNQELISKLIRNNINHNGNGIELNVATKEIVIKDEVSYE